MEDASQGHNDTVVLLNTVQQSLTTRLSRVVFFFFSGSKKDLYSYFHFYCKSTKRFFSFPFDIFTKSMHRGLRFHSLVVRKRVIPRTKLRCVCMCVCVCVWVFVLASHSAIFMHAQAKDSRKHT